MLKQLIVVIGLSIASCFGAVDDIPSFFPTNFDTRLRGRIGLGTCPDVEVADNFDITKIYGNWYTIAHYGQPSQEGERCRMMTIVPGDEEDLDIPCRVNVTYKHIDIKTGKSVTNKPAFIFVANDGDKLSYTMKVTDGPAVNWYPISVVYDDYLATHSCEEFPEDFPAPFRFFRQYNWIMHRKPDGKISNIDGVIEYYANLGISFEPFEFIEPDCKVEP